VWRQSGDTHTAQLPVDGDGEYTVEVRYADRSKNAFDVFTSEIIVIDTAEPVIEVRYVPEEYASEDGGRRYYGQPVTAEITVTERNFRARDMRAAITAADIVGADVNGSLISELAEYLTMDGSWTRRGDRSTATVVFDADANYAFGIEYTDLASHGAAYGTDSFTVDMTPPSAPEVTYAESVYTDILSAMTLGYYNAPVRVSVSVDDATAGVSRIVYSFTDANGAPRGEEFVIEVDGITYSNGGRTASASFYAPRAETQGGQFDGAVEILAFDRAGNGSGRAGERRIIVDSIAPELSVAYSEPYGARGGALYYPGDIDVTLRVRESNFDPGDVAVTVTFDGRESAAAPSWSGSGGVYAGVFTLSGDGVRTVSVRYTDRSENAMAAYTSDRLVIDTRPPEITLEGVNNETAYNGETVGFTLTVSDANLDADLNAVALRAVTRAPDGRFETYDVPLGEPEAAPDGTSFVYTAPNLEPDGIYTLTAGAADLSGNGARGISERSGGQLVRELVFSVNRHGAAFMPDADTAAITDAYYVREVTRDLRVAATDVSPLVSYSVLLGDAPLSEGVHYTVERSGGGEQWSRYDFIISKSLFEDEGTYNVVIASSDGADNNDFSDIKGVRLEFTVDRTPPALTVSGLVSGGRYKADTQAVTVIPRDDGGRLGRLRITLSDRRGAPVDTGSDGEPGVLIDLAGDALFDRLESGGGMITLRIPSGVGMSVDVLCEDVSVDALGEPNRYTSRFEDITVSDSGVVMFFAGGPLPILAAGGALASVAAGITATALRFRKKRRIA
jgi:hypothetical protein